jgi:hypothetical protein
MVNQDVTEPNVPVTFRPVQPPWTQFIACILLITTLSLVIFRRKGWL